VPVPIIHAIILGITQGLSEFLPISSSGHLLVVPWLFGWHDFQGSNSLEKTFDVALHLGTFVGAVIYFRSDIVTLARAALAPKRAPATVTTGTLAADHMDVNEERRLAWYLVIGSIPAAVIGALFESTIEDKLGKIWLIGVMMILFALVLQWADSLGGRRKLASLSLRDSLIIGSAQALALQPGVSRSGVTISASRIIGLDRDAAARFSFLLSLPIIGGAVLKKGLELAVNGFPAGFFWPFVAGILASGITGYLAVWITLRIIRTHSFTPFVVYRIILGTSLIILSATSFR
jgi:undecaprenyl-diphosphatase